MEMASFDGDDFDIDGSQIGGYGLHAALGHTHQTHLGAGGSSMGLEGGGPPHPNRSPQSSDDQLLTATANQPTASPTWYKISILNNNTVFKSDIACQKAF